VAKSPKIENGLQIDPAANGAIRIAFVKDGTRLTQLDAPGSAASSLACMLLEAAKRSQQDANLPLLGGTDRASTWAVIVPSKIGLGPSAVEGHHSLIASFGQAQLGISMDERSLRSLGEALVALTSKRA
jgi:hypothetical protein